MAQSFPVWVQIMPQCIGGTPGKLPDMSLLLTNENRDCLFYRFVEGIVDSITYQVFGIVPNLW